MMFRKMLVLLLCFLFGTAALTACGNGHNAEQDKKETESPAPEPTPTPLLDVNASDEELLDAIRDDLTVVAGEDFDETVKEIKADMGTFSGQLYQFEGIYTEADGTPAIKASASADASSSPEGDAEGEILPLVYLNMPFTEGTPIRVTGVINTNDVNGQQAPVLEVVINEELKE